MFSTCFARLSTRILVLASLSTAFWGGFKPAPAGPVEFIPICAIQSWGFDSPYTGGIVRTRGLVYADLDTTSRRGFFLQAENCDGEPATSDGIFVHLGARGDFVRSGDLVEVSGIVQETYGMTELSAAPGDILILSAGNNLPPAVDLDPPFDNRLASRYFESLEGMHVRLDQAVTVGPTDASGQTWVVRAGLGVQRVFPDDPAGTGEVVCVGEGLFKLDPQAKVGDRLQKLRGALDFTNGAFCLQLVAPPVVSTQVHTDSQPALNAAAGQVPGDRSFTVATFNLAGLYDPYDDPATRDTVLTTAEYQRRLQKRALAIHTILGEPDILAVQEAENRVVLQHLAARPELAARYGIVWADGPDERGLDVALFYRPGRIILLDSQVRQGCTSLVDGLGPDGNQDVIHPANALTCDSDGNGSLDGNRLFSRPPLVVHLQVCAVDCLAAAQDLPSAELWLIVNHWKSKLEDGAVIQYTRPRRSQEAQFVAGLAQEIHTRSPGASLVVIGDLNDYPASPPLDVLSAAGLTGTWELVDRPESYTYIYRGISQALDHVLFDLAAPFAPGEAAPAHINADYPIAFEGVAGTFFRSSDHDPLLVRFKWLDHFTYLPVVASQP